MVIAYKYTKVSYGMEFLDRLRDLDGKLDSSAKPKCDGELVPGISEDPLTRPKCSCCKMRIDIYSYCPSCEKYFCQDCKQQHSLVFLKCVMNEMH